MDKYEDYGDQVQAYVDRTPAWKQWLLWRVLKRDYCPRCNRVRPWKQEYILAGVGTVPLLRRLTCRKCGLSTPHEWFPALKQLIKELEGET